MSEFYATTNPDGTIEPHWVEGQREILCSAELIKQMIDNANRGILMELETHEAIRADRAKFIEGINSTKKFLRLPESPLTQSETELVVDTLDNIIRKLQVTPIGDGEK